ncbi:MAG: flagellin FliC5 [Herbinix sp.]|jgi:flagellin|nr:flagellin FliC5 [Herbinix sp.]
MMISTVSSKPYEQLSSMKKINSAADNAASVAIVEKLNSRRNGFTTGTDNAEAGKDMYRIAEGGLASISDSLQRIRDLSIQASNITYGDDEKKAIQTEIDGLKATIQDAAKGTEYNTKKLLDGSMADEYLATNPSGGGLKIQLEDSTLEELGIADYSVLGDFDVSKIDDAIHKVSESRSSIGAEDNRISSLIQGNNYSAVNLTGSVSRIETVDIGDSIAELKKNQILEQYRMFAMNAKNNQAKSISALIGN